MKSRLRYLLVRFDVARRGSKIPKIRLRCPVSSFAVQFVFEVFEHRGVLLDIFWGKL